MAGMDNRLRQLLIEASERRLSRREVVKRGGALGLSMSAVGGLLPARASAAPRAAQEQATITLAHDKGQDWQNYYSEMGELSASAIGIGIEGRPYPDTTSYKQAILQSLPTEEAPDVFTWWSGYQMEDLYKSGNLLDVTSLWQTAVQNGDLPETLASAFTFDGKQYGVVNHVSYWPVFYNKQVFAENEIEVPTTWADLMTAADTLKAAGVAPFFANVSDRWPSFIWFEELLIRTDPDFYEALMRGEQSYTDPVVVGVMETWKSMFDKEYFSPLDIPIDVSNTGGAFARGEVAMIAMGTWSNQWYLGNDMTPGEDYGAFILPNVNPDLKQNVIIFEAGPLAVPANTADAETITQFFTWWLSPEAQTEWAKRLGDTPANPKATSENPVLAELVSTISQQQYRLVPRFWEATPTPIVEGAVDELGRFMLNPDEYMAVLETIEGIAQSEWSKRK